MTVNQHPLIFIMQKPSHRFLLLACVSLWTVAPLVWAQDVYKQAMEHLQTGVVTWVAKQQGLNPQDVQIPPLDPRLKVRTCDAPLKHEFPFPSAETVKVSCAKPDWHLFIRVSLPTPNVRPGVASSIPQGTDKPVAQRRVWVVESHVSAGQQVQQRQLALAEREGAAIGPQALDPQADVKFMEAVRDLPVGSIVRQYDLRPQTLVKRGQMVQIMMGRGQGFQISARVEAMQDGRYGEQIKLKNPESGRIISGVVKGPGVVEGS